MVYVTWDDDVTSRDSYIMMSWIRHLGSAILDPPSWISKFLQNATEPSKITAMYTKSIKLCLKTVKHENYKFENMPMPLPW